MSDHFWPTAQDWKRNEWQPILEESLGETVLVMTRWCGSWTCTVSEGSVLCILTGVLYYQNTPTCKILHVSIITQLWHIPIIWEIVITGRGFMFLAPGRRFNILYAWLFASMSQKQRSGHCAKCMQPDHHKLEEKSKYLFWGSYLPNVMWIGIP